MPASRRWMLIMFCGGLRAARPTEARRGMAMSRKKKALAVLAVLLILLILLCDYLYWTAPLSLEKQMPEEIFDSTKLQLFYYDEFFDSEEIPVEEADLQTVLDGVAQTEVTRKPKFGTMSQSFFYLYFYYYDGYTRVMVEENGEIIVTPDHLKDRNLYFDGGEELYRALLALAQ